MSKSRPSFNSIEPTKQIKYRDLLTYWLFCNLLNYYYYLNLIHYYEWNFQRQWKCLHFWHLTHLNWFQWLGIYLLPKYSHFLQCVDGPLVVSTMSLVWLIMNHLFIYLFIYLFIFKIKIKSLVICKMGFHFINHFNEEMNSCQFMGMEIAKIKVVKLKSINEVTSLKYQ